MLPMIYCLNSWFEGTAKNRNAVQYEQYMPFCRRHFEIHFHDKNAFKLIFDLSSVIIGSCHAVAHIRRPAKGPVEQLFFS